MSNFNMTQMDARYVNALVDLIQWCNSCHVQINKVYTYQNGWKVTFANHPHCDAICHDGSYGSPYYGMSVWLKESDRDNDWTADAPSWETIGFPWDRDDVSVHSAETLAKMIYELETGGDWEKIEENEG